jgi:hypothetical protein
MTKSPFTTIERVVGPEKMFRKSEKRIAPLSLPTPANQLLSRGTVLGAAIFVPSPAAVLHELVL